VLISMGVCPGKWARPCSHNKVLPSSLVAWYQKEENLKLGECDLQGGDGDTSRPAAAPNVRRGAGRTWFKLVGE
jgi:hypothetical protein